MARTSPGARGDERVAHLILHLKYRRKLQKLSQQHVAERIGTKQSAISDWEIGRTQITAYCLARYAEAVGLKLVLTPDLDSDVYAGQVD